MRKLKNGAAALAVAMGLLGSAPAAAQDAVEDFYRGRTISLLIGFGAGGGYDIYARVLAQHLGRHIPGNPSVVPQNMPGAGSIVAGNHLFNIAPKDGTVIGTVASSALMQPLLGGGDEAQFVAADFGWLGSMDQSVNFCAIASDRGVTTFEEWLEGGQELAFGASGPAAVTFQHPMALRKVLGVNAQIIPGYSGTNEIVMAVETGELDGVCGLQGTSIRSQFQPLIDAGTMHLIIQMGGEPTDDFGDLPSVYDFVETEEDRQVLDLTFGQIRLARPVIAPPGVPEERLEALRTAFAETLQDPEFLADAERAGLVIDYVSAEAAQEMLSQFADYPEEVIARSAEAIAPDT